jgi:hypothetical protein
MEQITMNKTYSCRIGFGIIALALCTAAGMPAEAENYFLAVDVPAELGGIDFTPNQIVHGDNAAYSLESTFPEDVHLAAIHLTPDGVWLFAPAHPVNLDGTDYDPRDVVAYDGASYATYLDGSMLGIPEGVRIDAFFLDSSGSPVLSFDVPVDLGVGLYGRSDLVRFDSAFSLYWDGSGSGVPPYANLVGAATDSVGTLILTFDVPVTLDGSDYFPGVLVEHGPSGFAQRFEDPSWPPYAQLRDFSFRPAAGATPDGNTFPGDLLEVRKMPGSELHLSWGASCNAGDSNYAIYEGRIGSFDSHEANLCSTGGNTWAVITPNGRDMYYLVVPQNVFYEGSYGVDSTGVERPPSIASACLSQQTGVCQ